MTMGNTPAELVKGFLYGVSLDAIMSAKEELLLLGEVGAEAIALAIEDRFPLLQTQPGSANHAIRLAEVLVEWKSPRGLSPLLQLNSLLGTSWPQGEECIATLLKALTARASHTDIAALLNALQPRRDRAERADHRVMVAQAVTELAERNPTIELRPALVLLKPGLSTPLEYFTLYPRLRAALSKESLPIPATASVAEADLPIPVEEKELP